MRLGRPRVFAVLAVLYVLASSVPTPLSQQAGLQPIQLVGPHPGQDGFPFRAELDLEDLAQGADRLAQSLFATLAQSLFDALAQPLFVPLFVPLLAALPFGQREGAASVLLGDLGAVVQVELG